MWWHFAGECALMSLGIIALALMFIRLLERANTDKYMD